MKTKQVQRTLIVDDSVVFRSFLRKCLREVITIEVIGTASNGEMAMRKISKLSPDLVLLDMEMPVMNGIDVLKALQLQAPATKVIIVSSETESSAEKSIEALELGAYDFIIKPNVSEAEGPEKFRARIVRRASLARSVAQVIHASQKNIHMNQVEKSSTNHDREAKGWKTSVSIKKNPVAENIKTSLFKRPILFKPDIIAIGSSTGGPAALSRLISELPASLPVPVVITQHMPKSFVQSLASRLDKEAALSCLVAEDGMCLEAGHVYLAPGEIHMELKRKGSKMVFKLVDGPKLHHCKPAVDRTFYSLANLAPMVKTLAVVLTGMGVDGADGAKQIHAKQGQVIAQDKASSVVWGMPGATVKRGAAHHILPLDEIADVLCQMTGRGEHRAAT